MDAEATIVSNRPPPGSPHPPSDASLATVMTALWRGRSWIVATTLFALGVGVIFAFERGTLWSTKSVLHVVRHGPAIIGPEFMGDAAVGKSYTGTQAVLLRSTPILAAALEQPGLANSPIFEDAPSKITWLKKQLRVNVEAANLITVSLESRMRDAACAAINAVVDTYRQFHASRKRWTASGVIERLTWEMSRHEEELKKEQRRLLDFLENNPGAGLYENTANVGRTRLHELYAALSRAEIATIEAQAALQNAKQMTSSAALLQQMSIPGPTGLPANADPQQNAGERMRQQLMARRLALRTRLTADHPMILALDRQISQLEAQIAQVRQERISAYLGALEQSYLNAQSKQEGIAQKIERIESELRQTDPKQAEYRSIEMRVQRARRIADKLYQRIREIDISENMEDPERVELTVEVYEYATPDNATVVSSRAAIVAVCGFLGLLLGAGFASVRSAFDRRLGTVQEVAASTPLAVLGTIPRERKLKRKGVSAAWASSPSLAEAARSLRTSVYYATPDAAGTTIQVTSPDDGDGKSIVTCCLAIAMAQAGQRALVIDGDLRGHALADMFGIDHPNGLTEVLTGSARFDDTVVGTEEGFDLLVAGGHPTRNPPDLLDSEAFAHLLEGAARSYDRILVDSPPIPATADARILAARCDATLLVARLAQTTAKRLKAAHEAILAVDGRVLGVAVNGAPRRATPLLPGRSRGGVGAAEAAGADP